MFNCLHKFLALSAFALCVHACQFECCSVGLCLFRSASIELKVKYLLEPVDQKAIIIFARNFGLPFAVEIV
uniref:Putative secreted protein n=1 Tax=Amblyomma triste TaxID=251400 RepID=A0A023G2W4_AMBTT